MQRVAWDKLVEFGVRVLMHKGIPEANARYAAETAVKTEACGVHTHGAVLFSYLDKVIPEQINPTAEPAVVCERGATALIDANSGLGHLAMKLATEMAMAKARTHGTATVAVRNASWLGALNVHLMPLAEAGFIGQLWAQSSSCHDCAPFGGIDPKFSTNPLALAFPTGGAPMVSDFSTAAMSMGALNRLKRNGGKSDPPLFMDKDGHVTDDPNLFAEGGSVLFLGGEKHGYHGYALSLFCEALTAAAGGHCNTTEHPQRQSFTLIVTDPEAFSGAEYYGREMTRFLAYMRSSRLRPGVDAIRLPGERAYASLAEARTGGIALDSHRFQELQALAKKHGLPGLAGCGNAKSPADIEDKSLL